MDPDETLAQIRAELANGHGETDPEKLVELVGALDGWLSNGGFPPSAWQPPSPALTGNDHIVTNARHPVEGVYLGWSINLAVHVSLTPPSWPACTKPSPAPW